LTTWWPVGPTGCCPTPPTPGSRRPGRIYRAPTRKPDSPSVRAVELGAPDLVALAFAWLAELVGRIDLDGALAAIVVDAVERLDGGDWTLTARVGCLPFDGRHVRRRADVKSVTYHRLAVDPVAGGGWCLTAYLDL
jgi:SHS2 domain-containing protein